MRQLTDERIEEIRGHFDYFDADGSGTLDAKEFLQLFRVIAPEASRKEAEEGFRFIDEDESGVIEWDEFLEWWQQNWSVY